MQIWAHWHTNLRVPMKPIIWECTQIDSVHAHRIREILVISVPVYLLSLKHIYINAFEGAH